MINSEPEPCSVDSSKTTDTMKKRFHVVYLGSSSMDRRYTQCIQPWVMAEIRRKKEGFRDVILDVLPQSLRATTWNAAGVPEVLFEHKLQELTRFAKLHQDPRCFAYLSRQQLNNDDFECHVFLTSHEDMVPEIFNTIRETTKDLNKDTPCEQVVNHSNMGEGNFDQSKAFFEVKYMGRIKVKTRKVPTTFIDDLVDRFEAKEEERQLRYQQLEIRQRHASGASVRSLPASLDDAVLVTENNLQSQQQRLRSDYSSTESSTDELMNSGGELPSSSDNFLETASTFSSPEISKERERTGSSTDCIVDSSGSFSNTNAKGAKVDFNMENDDTQDNLSTDDADTDREVFCDSVVKTKPETNRIMLFQIGRQDISLISLDQKQIIMERKFKDISFVSQGNAKQDVFGVISREPGRDADPKSDGNIFVCYIFRCHSESVVTDIMCNLQTAFTMAFKQSQASRCGKPQSQNQICIMCPLHQLEKLCREINGMSPHAAYDFLVKRIQHLSDQDTTEIAKRLKSENPQTYDEMVEVLMICLRRLCERKQKEHIHISEGGKSMKSEFNIMDNDRNLMFKFDSFRNRAKKSLTNSFESLLRGRKKEDSTDSYRPRSGTSESESSWSKSVDSQLSTPDASPLSSPVVKEFTPQFPSPPRSPEGHRKRSSTVGAIPDPSITASRRSLGQRRQTEARLSTDNQNNNNHRRSPLKNMFILAGCPSPNIPNDPCISPMEELTLLETPKRKSSWRQAIFNKVVTPIQISEHDSFSQDADTDRSKRKEKLTPFQLRCLWKKAILETLLLIRMERENHNLQARQDAIEQQRRKTDYQEITPCLKEVTKTWDELLNVPQRDQTKISSKTIEECVKKGVPRCYRGEIWKLLIEQHKLNNPMSESEAIPETPYSDLLRQLTTHQHAILIDLGRTFPSHPYFSAQLGNGQLELFNLLKAYSLLDEEVGYCQGLSFVVGVLLMHMDESDAFETLKYLMFRYSLQKQYRPNMTALQIKLYQLTRLIHDHYRDLYDHFERHEIAPTLYAAPWFLTLFASQFPLGFVARCFDMIFIQGIDAIFKISLLLLSNHRELIMHCDSFESIVEFLKTTLPDMVHVQMERIISQAFEMDVAKELQAYEVEYHVLREEMMYSPQRSDTAAVSKLENINRSLRQQNMELLERLQQTNNHLHSLELNIHTHQANETKLKSHIRTLELERSALLNAVSKLRRSVPEEKLEKLELSLPAFTPSLPTSPTSNLTNNRLQTENLNNQRISETPLNDNHNSELGKPTKPPAS